MIALPDELMQELLNAVGQLPYNQVGALLTKCKANLAVVTPPKTDDAQMSEQT